MTAAHRLVVSIHDVSPTQMDGVRFLLQACDAIGARPLVLKVIPDEDGRNDIRRFPHFVDLLRREAAAGSEIVLHGYTHRPARPISGLAPADIRARLFAGGAAEFRTLTTREMAQRLAAGTEILTACGFEPKGFCAPGWLASAALPRLLQRAGFHAYVKMLSVQDLVSNRYVLTPWTGFMGADALQERLVRLGGHLLLAADRATPVLKVFLHPQGASESRDCHKTLGLLERIVRERRVVTYAELLSSAS